MRRNYAVFRQGAHVRAGAGRGPRGAQAGFSLVELLVTIIILAEVLVGLLIMFDSSSRLARAQTHVAELQQSLRVGQAELARYTRMSGSGGLPILPINDEGRNRYGSFPRTGPAISLYNNVEEQTIVQLLDPSAPASTDDLILPGSDVLLLRGVFSTPMYYVDPPIEINATNINADGELSLVITIPERTRITGRSWWDYPQEIQRLATRLSAAIDDGEPLAILLRDTLSPNVYVVAAFDHADITILPDSLTPDECDNIDRHASLPVEHIPKCIQFPVKLDPDDATGPGGAYVQLSSGTGLQAGSVSLEVDATPPGYSIPLPAQIGSIGLLEEYRLFVRAEWEVPGQFDTRLTPVLTRAEFLPGTDTQIDQVDIADNVIDLQIAIAADADDVGNDGYGDIREDGSNTDEVLFNAVAEADSDSDGTLPDTTKARGDTEDDEKDWDDPRLEFHFLRINTLVQARFPDLKHRAPRIETIEDFNRGNVFSVQGVSHNFNSELQYRRRWIQTMIELRNLM